MYLVDSVFPAPDSPDTMIDWLCFSTFMSRYALSAGKWVGRGRYDSEDIMTVCVENIIRNMPRKDSTSFAEKVFT